MKYYGLVLAGGQSRRMGEDKALLKYKNKTLLDHSIALLLAAGCSDVFVSGQREGYQSIEDIHSDSGPVGGVYSALEFFRKAGQLDDTPLIIIPVDMPLLKKEILLDLVARANGNDCCSFEGEIFPVILRMNNRVMSCLDGLFSSIKLVNSGISMKNMIKSLGGTECTLRPEYTQKLSNVNSKEDWERLNT